MPFLITKHGRIAPLENDFSVVRHDLSQVQQWSGVRYSCHAGICGAACQDAAADACADDHRQPSDGRSADPAGGGTYTPNWTSVSLYKKFTPGGNYAD